MDLELLLLKVVKLPCCQVLRLGILYVPLLLGDCAVYGWELVWVLRMFEFCQVAASDVIGISIVGNADPV